MCAKVLQELHYIEDWHTKMVQINLEDNNAGVMSYFLFYVKHGGLRKQTQLVAGCAVLTGFNT